MSEIIFQDEKMRKEFEDSMNNIALNLKSNNPNIHERNRLGLGATFRDFIEGIFSIQQAEMMESKDFPRLRGKEKFSQYWNENLMSIDDLYNFLGKYGIGKDYWENLDPRYLDYVEKVRNRVIKRGTDNPHGMWRNTDWANYYGVSPYYVEPERY
jgi:hypothetical protein